MENKKLVSVVIPAFNEERNIPLVAERLLKMARLVGDRYDFEIIFVNDGSRDNSLAELENLCRESKVIKAVSFSRNFGHQIALTAGYDFAKGDTVICLDADLQQPPELIPKLLAEWEKGNDIVYTIRKNNESLSFFKRGTASLFYYLINKVSNTPINRNAADFRLMSRRALDKFLKMRERDRFIRGMVNWIGFKSSSVEYEVQKRLHGKSTYSMFNLLRFAANAVTSFSGAPLRTIFVFGSLVALFSFIYAVYLVISLFFFKAQHPAGWPSLIIAVLFLGGVQLISVGILGEYIYRVFNEVKQRPLYIVDKTLNIDQE